MLTLILICVQYVQNAVFSFEKGSNGQKQSLWNLHHPIIPPPPANFPIAPTGKMPLHQMSFQYTELPICTKRGFLVKTD